MSEKINYKAKMQKMLFDSAIYWMNTAKRDSTYSVNIKQIERNLVFSKSRINKLLKHIKEYGIQN